MRVVMMMMVVVLSVMAVMMVGWRARAVPKVAVIVVASLIFRESLLNICRSIRSGNTLQALEQPPT